MPRSMWKGAISFGLVTIPVAVYPATEEKTLKFNQLHDEDMGRIRYKRMCEKDGEIVDFDHIVKGYEYDKDRYVVLTDEDFDKVPVESSRAIDIQQFVDLEEIDPMMYKKSYYLIPEETGAKAYALLREAMSQDNKVGIAKVSFRDKEHLAALRFSGDAFVLETMYWPDELREADFGGTKVDHKVRGQELEMARQLIANLTADWNPDEYNDEYREAHADDRRGQDQRRGDRDGRGRAHRQGRRPHGGVEGQRGGGQEARRRRRGRGSGAAGPQEDRRQEVLGQEVHGEEVDREEDDGTQEGRRRVIEGLPEGYGSRPATREDLAAIVELFHRFDATIQAEPDTMGEFLRWIWGQPQMDLARDTVLVTGPDGVEAFAQGNWDPETDEPFQLDWCVAPGSSSWARLAACLLSWAEAEATCRAGGATIRTGIVAEDVAGREVLEGRGFRQIRTSWDMGRELSPDERFPDPPDGITIRGFRAGEDEHLLYEIAETSFRDHWDHVERSFESFCARTFDETFDPGLTFFADVDGLTAGELIAFEDEARGYVAHLGVLREARGRGAAKALLRSAYAELAARGFRRVELSVDATSPTGAVALYEGMGMHVARSYVIFDGPAG